jgi:hypothetical protein
LPQAVFILGWGRSGTTWLSNLLAQHPDIATVIEPGRGSFESAYFSEVAGRYGDLNEINNFIELCAVLAQSAFFRYAGVGLEQLVREYPADYGELFHRVMDEFAADKGRRVWTEKTPAHTLRADEIYAAIPGALFIAIERNARDVLRSHMGRLEASRRAGRVKVGRLGLGIKTAQWILTWQHYGNRIERLSRRLPERLLRMRYENLLEDTEAEMRRVCEFLELDFDTAMLHSPYRPNSVFALRNDVTKEDLPSWPLGTWFRFWHGLARLLPPFLLAGMFRVGQTLESGLGRRSFSFFFFRGLEGAPDWMDKRRW